MTDSGSFLHSILANQTCIDVLYNFDDIKSLDDIVKRGISADLLCHVVGYAMAYKEATKDSQNPLDYVTFSGNFFEVSSVNGLMELFQKISDEHFNAFYDLVIMMRDHNDDMMVAAETGGLSDFFVQNEKNHNKILKNIDNLSAFAEIAQLDTKRIDAICKQSLADNASDVRIRRLLARRKKR